MAEKENRIAEDVVEYFLFPSLHRENKAVNGSLYLEECARSYLTYLSPTLIDVIWQNEGFKLKPVTEKGSIPSHLAGETNFGDNIEDEWFIVYLLFELTKHFPGLVAKVRDSDEEFLLIEAANALPKWLNPDSAENRVYIYQGAVHIIPVPQSPRDVAAFPHTVSSIGDAVECIRTYPEKTRASQKIQDAVFRRIKNFPHMMGENIHYMHTYIPASIAAILDEKPQLVAPAVRAFYYRDPVDLKCCRTFKYFRPGTRVMHRTQLTRCLYAQLVHQTFQPDKRSGWVMPSTSSPKFRSHDLGMKLAHGFEILCHKAENEGATDSSSVEGLPASGVRWEQFLQSLKDKNYFKGELEGSVLYKQFLENARKFYQDNFKPSDSATDPGCEVLTLLRTLKVDIEERRRAEQFLEPPDDDSWMNLTPESLDEMLQERSGNQGNKDAAFDLSKVADSMKAFVGNISGIEGAEFPSGVDDDDEDADIQFDSSGFISAMQEMFEFEEDNDSDSGSDDMEEYGWDEDEPRTSGHRHAKIKRPPSLDKYMDIMDRELAKTDVGKSFEKQKSKSPKKTVQFQENKTKVMSPSKDVNEEDDDFEPVDIDINAVKNLLESYGAQEGLPGPTSNILGRMGVQIPPDMDNLENGELTSGSVKLDNVKKTDKTQNGSDSDRPTPPPRSKHQKESALSQKSTPVRPPPPKNTSSQKKPTPSRPPPPRRPAPVARLDSIETDV